MTDELRGVPPEGGPRADALRDALERITEASMECSGLPNKWGEMLNAVVDAARAAAAGGQPPSDGMPSEPREKAVDAALRSLHGAPERTRYPDWYENERRRVREAIRVYLAAERGVSAVPPTQGQTDREWLADRFVAAIAGRDSEKFTKGFRIAGELVSDVVGEEFGRLIAERDKLRALHQPFVEVRTTACHAGSDGECNWSECPQLRDDEPEASGRHCPLDAIPQVHTGRVPPTEGHPK